MLTAFVALLVTCAFRPAHGGDAVVQILVDERQATVAEVMLPPGAARPGGPLEKRLIYALTPSRLQWAGDHHGTRVFPVGGVAWRPGGTEGPRNAGTTAARYLEFRSRLTPLQPDPAGPSFLALERIPPLSQKAPDRARLLFDNDHFRLEEIRLPAGERLAEHPYPGHVRHALEDTAFEERLPDGSQRRVQLPAGRAVWRGAARYAITGGSEAPAHYLLVTFKPPQRFGEYTP